MGNYPRTSFHLLEGLRDYLTGDGRSELFGGYLAFAQFPYLWEQSLLCWDCLVMNEGCDFHGEGANLP